MYLGELGDLSFYVIYLLMFTFDFEEVTKIRMAQVFGLFVIIIFCHEYIYFSHIVSMDQMIFL